MDWPTVGGHVLTFAAGIAAKVAADRWTDSRRSKQELGKSDRAFADVEALMPSLLNEIRDDLNSDSLVREFVTLPIHGNVFNHGHTKRFEYYASDHPDLAGKLAVLENRGYVRDVRVHQHSPIYRMTEEFVRYLTR